MGLAVHSGTGDVEIQAECQTCSQSTMGLLRDTCMCDGPLLASSEERERERERERESG